MSTPVRYGRPPVLTPEVIAGAVLDVGFSELTFAAVRKRLGVGQTTLFRHVKDRDELVRLGLDRVIEGVEWPSLDGRWRAVLEQYAFAAWHAWAAHPGSATEVARGIVPFGVMRLTDDLAAMLIRQGFTPANAVLAEDIVFDLVADNRRGVEHLDRVVPTAGPGREHVQELWADRPLRESADHGATTDEREVIHTAIRAAVIADPLEWFTAKLRVVLDGIEHSLAPSPD